MEAADAPQGASRGIVHVFVAATLFILATSALPTVHRSQDDLREWLDPFVDAIGLWQGQWALFAPDADKINLAVIAVVEFADGARAEWRSPDWREVSVVDKFRLFRFGEFTDGIRSDANRGAWSAFADYVVRTCRHPTGASVPTRVSLWRHFVNLPEPQAPLRPVANPFPLTEKVRFYSRDLEH